MQSRFIAFSVLAALASGALAADKDVEDMLRTLRNNYQKLKTARIEVTSVVRGQMGEDIPLTSVVTYKAPLSFRMVSKGPTMGGNSLVMITDGKQASTKTPDGKTEKAKFELDKIAAPLNLESLCLWDWKRQLSTDKGANMHDSKLRLLQKETWKDKDYIVLEETAERSKVFVRYYIEPKTKFIVRTVVYNLEDTTQVLQDHKVTKMEVNPKVEASLFKVS